MSYHEGSNWQAKKEDKKEPLYKTESSTSPSREGVASDKDIKDLQRIKNYFGSHSKTTFEHWAFSFINDLIEKYKASRGMLR